jgi:pimeloyl-ACP methyl ester carboxylesterase
MASMTLDHVMVGEISALVSFPAGARHCPVVFSVPGYADVKERALPLAYRLAARGIACISFDPAGHGERENALLHRAHEPELGGIYPAETGLDIYFNFLRVIAQCPADILALRDYFARDDRLDLSRAGVCGHSQGGYASFLALADIPELKAAVPMMGIPTFVERVVDLLDETAWSNTEWGRALEQVNARTAERVEWVRAIDPAPRLLQQPPRPLLMMNGDYDNDQPKGYTLRWLRDLRPRYVAQPEMLRWNVYPLGHVITDQMLDDTAEWFGRWL